jgi:hypothetical protein
MRNMFKFDKFLGIFGGLQDPLICAAFYCYYWLYTTDHRILVAPSDLSHIQMLRIHDEPWDVFLSRFPVGMSRLWRPHKPPDKILCLHMLENHNLMTLFDIFYSKPWVSPCNVCIFSDGSLQPIEKFHDDIPCVWSHVLPRNKKNAIAEALWATSKLAALPLLRAMWRMSTMDE